MSVYSHDEVQRSLLRKGFVLSHGKRTHLYFRFTPPGFKTEVTTYLSHNKQDVTVYLQKQMAQQIGITKREFEDLVRCPLSQERLLELLLERGKIRP